MLAISLSFSRQHVSSLDLTRRVPEVDLSLYGLLWGPLTFPGQPDSILLTLGAESTCGLWHYCGAEELGESERPPPPASIVCPVLCLWLRLLGFESCWPSSCLCAEKAPKSMSYLSPNFSPKWHHLQCYIKNLSLDQLSLNFFWVKDLCDNLMKARDPITLNMAKQTTLHIVLWSLSVPWSHPPDDPLGLYLRLLHVSTSTVGETFFSIFFIFITHSSIYFMKPGLWSCHLPPST